MDTVDAMNELAMLATFGGIGEAHALASEALAMGQALDVGSGRLAELFTGRGIAAGFNNRYAEAAADLEFAARLAERAGETVTWSRASSNLSSILVATDAPAAAAAGRRAIELARQLGDRFFLPGAQANTAVALMFTGDWDEAEQLLRQATEADGFDDDSIAAGYVMIWVAMLPALRGEPMAPAGEGTSLIGLRASEDPQDLSAVAMVDAFHAAASGQRADVLAQARVVLKHAAAVGIANEAILWAWPLAARTGAGARRRRRGG